MDGSDMRTARNRITSDLVMALSIAAITLLYILTIRTGHPWGGDFAMYIMNARNLVEGLDYKFTQYITTDFVPHDYIGPQAYPPVFPAMLAPIYALSGLDLWPMKVLVIVSFGIALWLMYRVLESQGMPRLAMISVLLVGISPWIWDFKDDIRSDLPFLMFLFGAIYAVQITTRRRHLDLRSTIAWGLLIGTLVFLAYGSRPVGIMLIPAIGLHYLLHKPRRMLLLTVITVTFGLFFLWQRSYLQAVSSFTEPFSLDPAIVVGNLINYPASFSNFFDNGYSAYLRYATFVVLAALAVAGFVIRLRKRITIVELFPLFYVIPFIFYVYVWQQRYLIPILPLFIFWALIGTKASLSRFGELKARMGVIGLTLLLVAFNLASYSQQEYPALEEGIARPESRELFDYIRNETASDSVIVFFKPRVSSLYTGRRSAPYYGFKTFDRFWEYLNHIGASHIIIEHERLLGPVYGTGPDFLQAFVDQHPHAFEQVFVNPDFVVYKARDDAPEWQKPGPAPAPDDQG
jgi:4-amino-4-deoxy-L-arabinose transferase-like glycosyltransferase